MRRVRLTRSVKHDQPFIVGDKDTLLHLSDHDAQFVVHQQLGVYADNGERPGPSRAELEQQEAGIATSTLQPLPAGENTGTPDPPKRPYGNGPKSAWVRYACAVDQKLTQERAELMTKADLMSRYGEPL